MSRLDTASTCSGRQVIYAPSLQVLPQGEPLVLATLPVIDWNLELQRALERLEVPVTAECFAAVFMVDPFTLWEDLALLLRSRSISGVINFPPAAISDGASPALSGANPAELDRLKWFSDAGFMTMYAAASPEDLAVVRERLGPVLAGSLYLEPDALDVAITDCLEIRMKETDPDEPPVWLLGQA